MKNPYQKNYSNFYTEGSGESLIVIEEGIKAARNKFIEIPFSPKKRVLDVACGISLFGKIFSNNIYGIDINKAAVKTALKNGVKAKLGDAEKKLDFPDGYFDIVIASHIIEHLVNPDHFILEAKRVLKKGGLFILVTPNLASWFNRIILLFGAQPFFSEVSTVDKTLGLKFTRKFTKFRSTVGHLRIFTPNALTDILEFHGFKIFKTTGMEFVAFPPLLRFIDRLISNNYHLSSIIIVVGKKK